MHIEVWTLRAELLGEEHPSTLLSRYHMALCRGELGDAAIATSSLEEIYALRCENSGEENIRTLEVLETLGRFYARLGEYADRKRQGHAVYVPPL